MDKRILKSENAIKSAMIELIGEKDPDRVTVKELCQKAGVNRSTFYDRFEYMDALVEAILADCLEDVCFDQSAIYDLETENGGIHHNAIRSYIDRFLENQTLMRFCMCENGEKYISKILAIQIRISMREIRESIKYYPAYFQNTGVLHMLIEWIRADRPVPKETIVEIIHQFSKAMYYGY